MRAQSRVSDQKEVLQGLIPDFYGIRLVLAPNAFLFSLFKRRSSNSNAFSIVRFQNLEPSQKRYFEQAMCGKFGLRGLILQSPD